MKNLKDLNSLLKNVSLCYKFNYKFINLGIIVTNKWLN